MSNLYNLEPQPTGKVVLNTGLGDLTLELFAKQTPLASRNFLQHCLDGYYDNTIFHRLVPGFIIQGGDPTGTGSGGLSAINNGELFQDEFHSRLKFNRRGLLGMANEGPDSNGSQFFLTLNATPELQGKNTMFGRIEGDTIYNLMKMADAELIEGESSDRPLYPTKIISAEIIVNPFEDMVARIKQAPRSLAEHAKKDIKKRKKPAGKNVLSFGDNEGEDYAAPILKKVKANPKLISVEEPEERIRTLPEDKQERRTRTKPDTTAEVNVPDPRKPVSSDPADQDEEEDMESENEDDKRRRQLEKTNEEIKALKASMKRGVEPEVNGKQKPKTALEAMIPDNSSRGRKRGKATDEKGAIDMFESFKKRLEGLSDHTSSIQETAQNSTATSGLTTEPESALGDEEAALCDLHFIANCQSCISWDDATLDLDANTDGQEDPGWMTHRLNFAKDVLGKDLEWKRKMAEVEVIDPREKARAIKEERRKGKENMVRR